jgi:hypothetical protein
LEEGEVEKEQSSELSFSFSQPNSNSRVWAGSSSSSLKSEQRSEIATYQFDPASRMHGPSAEAHYDEWLKRER